MHRAAVWQHSSNSNIKIVHNSIEHFLWNPSDFSPDDVLSCLWIVFTNSVFQVPLSENSQAGWDLGNRMARGYRFDAKWIFLMGGYTRGIQVICLRNEVTPHFSNRALEYLRHNFPWDRLISCKSITPGHPIPKISTRLTIFWRGTWKTEFVKTIHRQDRTSPEKKLDGFHSKCSVKLWTILKFELLLCCHTAAWCMDEHSINYRKGIVKYWF